MQSVFTSALRSVAALALTACALPVLAGTSSVVSVGSESIGSSSTSLETSSDSISGGKRVAQGDYKVIEVAALEQRPDMLRVRLQALAGSEDFYLLLPRAAAARGEVAPGQVITAAQRPYGLAFTAKTQTEAFFLVLDDAWYRELDSRPIGA